MQNYSAEKRSVVAWASLGRGLTAKEYKGTCFRDGNFLSYDYGGA